ncbi:MAG TPA: DUF4124 domain-containing protein [Usitatibacteraceae bacterium]|nr:DUF4124 domain-containing protein [Usitatibacteraceae bacterium]
MKTLWIGVAASLVSPFAFAQTTIYKHVDESGRVTYTNRPMKGAIVLDLEPLSTLPAFAPATNPSAKPAARAPDKTTPKPSVAVVTPRGLPTAVASRDHDAQRGRDELRRKTLEDELAKAEKSFDEARKALLDERRNPTLIAAVRAAQQADDPTPAQQAEMRANIDRASGRIRGLQATVAEHEKNIEALKKELGAL